MKFRLRWFFTFARGLLSTLLCFITLQPVKSPRDGYGLLGLNSLDSISAYCIDEMAFTLPFLAAGPGAYHSRLEDGKEDQFVNELRDLISILKSIDKDLYVFSLETIRLIYLSILVKRDDFGLAYLLLISAIEAIGQKISKKQKSKKHDKEPEWELKAINDQSFKELLSEYKKIRGKDTLTNIFVRCILKYNPPEKWESLIVSRNDFNYTEWNDSIQGSKHPTAMDQQEIEKVLRNAYEYRSRFVHQGMQPPHEYPEARFNKFFEAIETYNSKSDEYKSDLSPSYELMLGIAKNSIFEWLRAQVN